MSSAKETKDHATIRKWVEKHKGMPAVVDTNGKKDDDDGLLRIKFSDDSDNLEEISWEEFFAKFDENGLTFLYQDEKNSRFNKFVYEETASVGEKKSAKNK